jgi:transcriptional regulator with XRE-family HTH domain
MPDSDSVFPGFDRMSIEPSELIDSLVRRRRELGLSQTEVAARMGTSQSAVARLERGGVTPTFAKLGQLVRACGFELEVRLVPADDHDWSLIQRNLRLTPTQRLEKAAATRRLVAAGRRARQEGTEGRGR